ncbi:MAG: NADH-quinone oxidoreductase subunit L, partial [Candidatus Omnitrophica bacterium]|nr:NADH-quinone oxidoreductase subunit L [Candidatus Omnitrophota bacterium]
MTENILILFIMMPLFGGLLAFIMPQAWRGAKEGMTLLATLLNLALAVFLFKQNLTLSLPWAGFGMDFALRLYHFSAFIILATAGFGILIALYSCAFMREKKYVNQFYSYFLISIAFVNGAVLADNLVMMLFFWGGLLLTLFGMIAIGRKEAFKSAIKAFIIVGIADVCLMIGIALTGHLANTLVISKINLPLDTVGSIAFIFLMIGAIAKAGSMPFHSWIPDAAVDAPLPFMAFLPAALEKLLGIYFLARISLDMFQLVPQSWISMVLMIIGGITIILAVMMALIQKDYKRLLSYHAISQVGYMILGIGTAVPAGIVGGLFHMINHAMYKSGLFLTGGSVEKQTGTTNLEKLGGLAKKMPLTFVCFLITAASISGVPPFNGFFSKELVYDGALERGIIFYIVAVAGSFFTAASFLKLGHAAFLGKVSEENKNVKEAPLAILFPMIIIASMCVLFGVYNYLPLSQLIQPILGEHRLEGHNFWGLPTNMMLIIVTLVVLAAAVINHIWGVKKAGSGLKAADHIHYAPGLHNIYDRAEKRFFDPYDMGLKFMAVVSKVGSGCDQAINWIYDVF